MSSDGRFRQFPSDATNLGTDTNANTDIYVRDRGSSLTQRVSTSFFLGEGDSWSTNAAVAATGGVVAVTSAAANLVDPADINGALDIYRRSIISPTISGLTGGTDRRGTSGAFTLSGRGFLAPSLLTSGTGITFSITASTPTQITGTITVAPNTAIGQHNVNVVDLGGVPGFFSGTLCPAASA